MGLELATLVVIGTDCTDGGKSLTAIRLSLEKGFVKNTFFT
jgi:hypothetical protein